jgi:hypothetical protein
MRILEAFEAAGIVQSFEDSGSLPHIPLSQKGLNGSFKIRDHILVGFDFIAKMEKNLDQVVDQNIEKTWFFLHLSFPVDLFQLMRTELTGINEGLILTYTPSSDSAR